MKSTRPVGRTRVAEKAAAPKVRLPAPTRVRPPVPEEFARFLLNRHSRAD